MMTHEMTFEFVELQNPLDREVRVKAKLTIKNQTAPLTVSCLDHESWFIPTADGLNDEAIELAYRNCADRNEAVFPASDKLDLLDEEHDFSMVVVAAIQTLIPLRLSAAE